MNVVRPVVFRTEERSQGSARRTKTLKSSTHEIAHTLVGTLGQSGKARAGTFVVGTCDAIIAATVIASVLFRSAVSSPSTHSASTCTLCFPQVASQQLANLGGWRAGDPTAL